MLKRILGLLGWLGVALVFAAVAVRFLRPEQQPLYNGLAISGLVCTLLYILSQWREVMRSFSGREARFGTLAFASIAVVLAILVGINYLASRRNKRWDLTAAKQFTLSDQTRKVLQSLERPVTIRVFDRTEGFERFRERLDEYTYASDKVTVEYIDVDRRPAEAQRFEVQQLGTVALEYDGRVERVTSDGEQELTNGLIKVIQGRQTKVYFVQGHGERVSKGRSVTATRRLEPRCRPRTSCMLLSSWRSRTKCQRMRRCLSLRDRPRLSGPGSRPPEGLSSAWRQGAVPARSADQTGAS